MKWLQGTWVHASSMVVVWQIDAQLTQPAELLAQLLIWQRVVRPVP